LLLAGCSEGSWLQNAHILVQGYGVTNTDCNHGQICQHNENTDLINWKGAIWLVHRTAKSQILGDDSALHVYKTTDGGAHFKETAWWPAPTGRDLRDPAFYIVGDELYMKALTRLPVTSARDSFVETITVGYHTRDGVKWDELPAQLAPTEWSFWRVKEHDGVYYSAAYHDGDTSVALFSSTDGVNWTQGPDVLNSPEDTPLETELQFMPSGALLALGRMDGTDQELLGSEGRLRTKMCWAVPPYDKFDCRDELDGQRLDGPVSFFWRKRLFVIARKHLGADGRKRTALFELTGNFDGGPLAIRELHELPSAGDTAYAGVATVDSTRMLASWYSGDRVLDQTWIIGILDASDIWQGTIDFSRL
jgi:hypothetical protein